MPPPPNGQYAFTGPSARVAGAVPPSTQRRFGENNQSAPSRQPYQPAPGAVSTANLLPGRGTTSSDSQHENPFRSPGASTISGKFSLSPDPRSWGADLSPEHREPDDFLHNPDPKGKDSNGSIFTFRGLANLGCIAILALALITLFAGYPIISHFVTIHQTNLGGFNLGGINATGQVMEMDHWALIDPDTPQEAYTYPSVEDGTDWQLVFSDEFEDDGRTFYPGDDPFWEAMDMHYWGTNNLEWYDPGQITTEGGSLVITLDEQPNHGLDYIGGIMTTWNKFCFTGGILLSRVVLPGRSDVYGLWPALWTMGNLGRAGHGASVEGMWPYTYEACDVGTLPNQTLNGLPEAARTTGEEFSDFELSYLPGQRLSACTCPGEAHPGPVNKDGTFVGRSAPEIDVFEAQVSEFSLTGHVSASSQWAPFDDYYAWNNASYTIIYDEDHAELNTYRGGPFQQTTSGIVHTNQDCYEMNEGCFSEYGFEYKEGYEEDDAYITWIVDGKPAWRFGAGGMGANDRVEISARPVPKEPMYLILNLGLSENFGSIDYENLVFPTKMSVDWVRVYQHPDRINIGCDPPGFPTTNYINAYIEAYTNPNLTTWVDDYGQTFPKNRLVDEC